MECPEMLKGDSLKRIFQGALFGCIATAFIGFNYAGWTLGSKAEKMAADNVLTAITAALTPICIEKFQSSADVKENIVKLKAIESWKQDKFIEEGGWATFAGNDKANLLVANSCARSLNYTTN